MKVVGFGDNVVDKYLHTKTYYPGGNCVNFAAYAKQIGADSAYLGVVGSDEMAGHILETLASLDIDTSHCVQLDGETGCCEVTLENGDRKFVSWNEGGITLAKPMVLGQKELEYLTKFDLIHSGCYGKIETEISKLKEVSAVISYDFSEEADFRTDEYLKLICPHIDFALFSCADQTMDEIKALIEKVANLGTTYILATRGIQGSVFFDGKDLYEGKAHAVENPVDTMGCGDSFVTRFLVSLLEKGWKKDKPVNSHVITESLEKAAVFAANNCLVSGAFGKGKSFE